MSYVFISYKREDELRVARIARALEAEGIEVWWDRGLPGGESWHANIESKLLNAGCVLVTWSIASSAEGGGYVREEARRGLTRNILVPVLLDRIEQLPLGFGEIQAIDLTRWRGDRRDADFQDLVDTIRAKLANAPLPTPKGPGKRLARRLLWGSASGAGFAAALLAFNLFGIAARICTLPGPQPGLSDSCGLLGVGERPTRAERLAWQSRAPGSCAALREHVARFPDGYYRSEAADLLTARKVSIVDAWEPSARDLSLFEAAGPASKSEAAAQKDALERGQADSDRLCRDFGAGTLYRFVSSTAIAEQWSCSKSGSGFVCGFEGHAQCQLKERRQSSLEHCG